MSEPNQTTIDGALEPSSPRRGRPAGKRTRRNFAAECSALQVRIAMANMILKRADGDLVKIAMEVLSGEG